ncbi:MAG: hypothetical protein WBQ25_05810 [Nitrososphaeraceae archaeon]
MYSRTVLVLTIGITALLFFTSVSSSWGQIAEFLTFKNSRTGITIEYPSDWTIIKKNPSNPYAVVSFRIPFESNPQLFHVGFGVSIEKLFTNKISLADYIASRLAFKPSNCLNFRLIDSKPSNLTGFYPAHQLVYSCTIPHLNNMDFKYMERIMVKDKKAYLLSYGAETTTGSNYFDKYLPVAQRMINSFQLTK